MLTTWIDQPATLVGSFSKSQRHCTYVISLYGIRSEQAYLQSKAELLMDTPNSDTVDEPEEV